MRRAGLPQGCLQPSKGDLGSVDIMACMAGTSPRLTAASDNGPENDFEETAQQFFEILDQRLAKLDAEVSWMKAEGSGQVVARLSAWESRLSTLESQLESAQVVARLSAVEAELAEMQAQHDQERKQLQDHVEERRKQEQVQVDALQNLDDRLLCIEAQLKPQGAEFADMIEHENEGEGNPTSLTSQPLRNRLASLEQSLGGPNDKVKTIDENDENDEKDDAQVEIKLSRALTHEELARRAADSVRASSVHPISATVYEAIIFVFFPGMRCFDVQVTIGTYILNAVLQLVFVYVMFTTFLGGTLPPPEEIYSWRAVEGHQVTLSPGPSVVSRICGHDMLLGIHQDKVWLLMTMEQYTRDGAGFFLAVACLMVWTLNVSGEVRECISFARALRHVPLGSCSMVYHEGRPKIDSISRPCLWTMLAITTMRLSVALALGYVGARWLVQEIELTNLLLNAGALAFILQVDEILFEEVMSRRIKAIVEEVAPLEKAVKKKAGGMSMLEMVHKFVLGFSIVFVFIMSAIYLRSLNRQINEIKTALCEDPQDFMVVRHQAGLYMAAPTPHYNAAMFEEKMGSHVVQEVVESGSLAKSVKYLLLPDNFELQEWSSLPIHSLMSRLTDNVPDVCVDHNDAFGGQGDRVWLQFADAVGRNFGGVSACQDVRQYCDSKHHYVVRALCPSTCGCALPRSGLLHRGPESGCPYRACLETDEHQAAFNELPCRDEAKQVLAEMDKWSWLCDQFFARYGDDFFWADDLEAAKQDMAREGCEYLRAIPDDQAKIWCQGSASVGTSMLEFCPEECNCTSDFVEGCPPACATP